VVWRHSAWGVQLRKTNFRIAESPRNLVSPAEPAGDVQRAKPPLDLRDPVLAGIMAWLIPGAGHWYQGRRTKALLFFVTIMGSFSYGLWLGGGRVVYAAWGPSPEEKRLPYFCQIGVGAAALPALWQANRFRNSGFEAVEARKQAGTATISDWFMAPPNMAGLKTNSETELDVLNFKYHRYFELGTVYTMIAGLLNLLVIFDACGGPAFGVGANRADKPDRPDKRASPVATPPPAA
jgi:hypothetical protein